ncbi:hypothetical protein [Nocardia sp. NBC_01327]|uniref:hypothetical protein n=1 Tax=Nocardia sp. NBC_01327 TaxID=2903593 RepID=UPI002E12ED72|nr:hypothetical protein OG326_24180 [Nocardia sp. NBC_01327]
MTDRDLIAERQYMRDRLFELNERELAALAEELWDRIAELEGERVAAKGEALTQTVRADGLNTLAENFRHILGKAEERIAELEQQAGRRIEFPEQLAVLPFLAIVREVIRSSPSGANYGAVWERRTSGWECIAGSVDGRTEPKLPVLVLWQSEVSDRG